MAQERAERRLAAILAADMVGYSRLMESDEAGTHAALKTHYKELIEPRIATFGGRIVKNTGDGFLAEFASAVDAVQCAVEFQRGMRRRIADIPDDRKIRFRVGINVGDVIADDGDIFGDGVNVAVRLEGLAEAGGVLVSANVHEQVEGKVDAAFQNEGEQRVKNIKKPIGTYRVLLSEQAGAAEQPLQLPDKPSIAVLPFVNMSGDAEQEYFADGIIEDIITALSRFRWFFVIARNSTFVYKGSATSATRIARDLGVRYVLEGSVRKAGSRVRVTAQLIDGASGNHIWAERYDRELTDIFALQDEITASIAAAVEPELYQAEGARSARKTPTNLDSWDYFLRARMNLYRGTREDNAEAQRLAAKAIALDPESVQGHTVLAVILHAAALNGWCDSRGAVMAKALEAAKTAVSIDDKDAEAHQILGMAYLAYRQHDLSISELETAIELNPNYAHGFASLAMSLTYSGRPLDALALYDKAFRQSPRDPRKSMWRCAQALAYLTADQYEQAVQCAKYSLEQKWSWLPSHRFLVSAYGLLGKADEAKAALASFLALNPRFTISKAKRSDPFKNPADFERLAEGLRRAGLPE